jgi:hypothetical protein
MPMRRPERPLHAAQLDLFRANSREPDWRQLPVEAREKATHLIARMLRERRTRSTVHRPGGGRDDE